ncbi:MAG: efflux RND transporter periplasmic adaptor subunit, partial [Bdellovibrio sp.]|nr:efflux RND transporter periplasmic adaptor subunit [Bdellovibrio sp.]
MKHLPLLILIIFFNFSCTQLLPLKAIRVSRTTVESTVTTTSAGTVEAVQQAVLGFSAQGRIEHINTAIGDHVKKSQILAELENSDFKIIFQNSDRELKRAEELFQAGLVSQAALDDSKRNYEVAKANLDKTMIKAPFDGVISELKLEIGELYQATQIPQSKAPIRLIDMKPRIIKGDVDELDLSKIKTGLKARVKILAIRSKP